MISSFYTAAIDTVWLLLLLLLLLCGSGKPGLCIYKAEPCLKG